MGRGRAKAKQTKVARQLKYYTPDTDLSALERELHGPSQRDVVQPATSPSTTTSTTNTGSGSRASAELVLPLPSAPRASGVPTRRAISADIEAADAPPAPWPGRVGVTHRCPHTLRGVRALVIPAYAVSPGPRTRVPDRGRQEPGAARRPARRRRRHPWRRARSPRPPATSPSACARSSVATSPRRQARMPRASLSSMARSAWASGAPRRSRCPG